MLNAWRHKITRLDYILITLLLSAAGYFVFRVTVSLEYNWNWGQIWQYLFRYDQEQERWVANYLIDGFFTTIRLSLWATILAIAIGLLVALARTGKLFLGQLLARCYIEVLRNVPPLVIIFLFYFFLADQLMPILGLDTLFEQSGPAMQGLLSFCFAPSQTFVPFISALLTLAFFESAYVAEIFRSGIASVPIQQWEAAQALGLKRYQVLYLVVLPQAFRRVLPPLAGQVISLIKDSAIVSVISIQELTYQGTQLMASTYLTIEVWIIIAVMYLMLTLPCSLLVSLLEKRMKRNE